MSEPTRCPNCHAMPDGWVIVPVEPAPSGSLTQPIVERIGEVVEEVVNDSASWDHHTSYTESGIPEDTTHWLTREAVERIIREVLVATGAKP